MTNLFIYNKFYPETIKIYFAHVAEEKPLFILGGDLGERERAGRGEKTNTIRHPSHHSCRHYSLHCLLLLARPHSPSPSPFVCLACGFSLAVSVFSVSHIHFSLSNISYCYRDEEFSGGFFLSVYSFHVIFTVDRNAPPLSRNSARQTFSLSLTHTHIRMRIRMNIHIRIHIRIHTYAHMTPTLHSEPYRSFSHRQRGSICAPFASLWTDLSTHSATRTFSLQRNTHTQHTRHI